MWHKIKRLQSDESGAELIEFIGVLPILLMVAMIVWQLIIAAQTFVIASSAAREGARAAAVCPHGNITQAVQSASPGYDPEIRIGGGGGSVAVTVGLRIPTFRIPYLPTLSLPTVYSTAVMRQECY